jgi:DNA-binding response OmpR family regulator
MGHPAFPWYPDGAEPVSDRLQDVIRAVRDARKLPAGNLLFVDSDDLLIEMIESGLSFSRPKWGVIAARHPAEALEVLALHSELDAIVTEIVFDGSIETGRAFLRDVNARWPEIPLFVMTRLERDELGGLDNAEYMAKPPDMDFLVSQIDRTIRRQKESRVRGIALSTFLQILELEQKTCTVAVSHRGRVGELFFRKGRLQQARLGEAEGKEALFRMLSMREHTLRVIDRCEVESAHPLNLASLMMEWSVREDHGKRGSAVADEEME